MHWDDNVWMAPYRISYQMGELQSQNAEICGVQQMLYYELKTGKSWLYQYPEHWPLWLAGGSLLITRLFSQERLFPNVQVGSDTRFVWLQQMKAYAVLQDYRFYVACIHENNTSPKSTADKIWQPHTTADIQQLIPSDWPFYESFSTEGKKQYLFMENGIANKTPESNKVSACLLAYNQPRNLQLIIDSLHHYAFIDEIVVWNNNAANKLCVKGSKVRVIDAAENWLCYVRFLCAQQAKNRIVYFQDDDALIDNVAELYQAFFKRQYLYYLCFVF